MSVRWIVDTGSQRTGITHMALAEGIIPIQGFSVSTVILTDMLCIVPKENYLLFVSLCLYKTKSKLIKFILCRHFHYLRLFGTTVTSAFSQYFMLQRFLELEAFT